jgi:gluconolactonase
MELSRRTFLKAAGAAATLAALPGKALADRWSGTKAVRLPDPLVQVLDDRFQKYQVGLAVIERLWTGCRWAEGPVWFGDWRAVIWSDIPNDRMLKFDEETGQVSIFRKPSNYANGNARDNQGRLITAEHGGGRRISRTEYDGTITVLCDKYNGKRFNSPNDVVVKKDDSIWFTDPPFGISGHYEGHKATPDLPHAVYRWDAKTGQVTVLTEDIKGPNGLCFSPDEKKLYVIEARTNPRQLRVFDVVDNGTKIANSKVFVTCGPMAADGMRCDRDGNIWVGMGGGEGNDGVAVYAPDAKMIGKINTPERVANLCFGGAKRNRLFMCGTTSLYSLHTEAEGATLG